MRIIKTTLAELLAQIATVRAELESRAAIEGEADLVKTLEQSKAALWDEDYDQHRHHENALTFRARVMAISAAQLRADSGDYLTAYQFLEFAQTGKPASVRNQIISNALTALGKQAP